MKRHESLIPLSRFHRSILFLALISKKNAPEIRGYPTSLKGKINYAITFYEGKLREHFQTEEKRLLPWIKGREPGLDQLVNEILQERQELDHLFHQLKKDRKEHTLNTFGELLEKHIRKEERQLFQKIQEVVPDRELNEFDLQE